MRMRIIPLLGLALLAHAAAQAATPPRCLYVSSYHAGYEWNDSLEGRQREQGQRREHHAAQFAAGDHGDGQNKDRP